VAFLAIGVLVALVLIVRDLGDDGDVSEKEGTLAPAQSAAVPGSAVPGSAS
jgi:hypothetical protein